MATGKPRDERNDEPTAATGETLEVLLAGGRRIRVAAGFDAATLRQLLAVLEEKRADECQEPFREVWCLSAGLVLIRNGFESDLA
jgi:hypothetical protein